MLEYPEVAIVQHTSGVLKFEVGNETTSSRMASRTSLISSIPHHHTTSGAVTSHASLATMHLYARKRCWASASKKAMSTNSGPKLTSQDLHLSTRLQIAGFEIQMASYHGEEFKEGVSVTVFDEVARYPLRYWYNRSPPFMWSTSEAESSQPAKSRWSPTPSLTTPLYCTSSCSSQLHPLQSPDNRQRPRRRTRRSASPRSWSPSSRISIICTSRSSALVVYLAAYGAYGYRITTWTIILPLAIQLLGDAFLPVALRLSRAMRYENYQAGCFNISASVTFLWLSYFFMIYLCCLVLE